LKKNITLVLDDPAGNSYIQSLTAPMEDPRLQKEFYERSFEQNDELGLNDMKMSSLFSINATRIVAVVASSSHYPVILTVENYGELETLDEKTEEEDSADLSDFVDPNVETATSSVAMMGKLRHGAASSVIKWRGVVEVTCMEQGRRVFVAAAFGVVTLVGLPWSPDDADDDDVDR
uniref:Zpr1 domain-containing protein n=1 Tax=Heligmosomoides polygyrus TaxID=6339 RepID=A0A183G454_HELPZ